MLYNWKVILNLDIHERSASEHFSKIATVFSKATLSLSSSQYC